MQNPHHAMVCASCVPARHTGLPVALPANPVSPGSWYLDPPKTPLSPCRLPDWARVSTALNHTTPSVPYTIILRPGSHIMAEPKHA